MLASSTPVAFRQMRMDCRNPRGRPILGGDEDEVRVISGEESLRLARLKADEPTS